MSGRFWSADRVEHGLWKDFEREQPVGPLGLTLEILLESIGRCQPVRIAVISIPVEEGGHRLRIQLLETQPDAMVFQHLSFRRLPHDALQRDNLVGSQRENLQALVRRPRQRLRHLTVFVDVPKPVTVPALRHGVVLVVILTEPVAEHETAKHAHEEPEADINVVRSPDQPTDPHGQTGEANATEHLRHVPVAGPRVLFRQWEPFETGNLGHVSLLNSSTTATT